MPWPLRRAGRVGRYAVPWLVGPVVLWARGPLSELAPASRCPAALDVLGIAIVRRWPALPVGQLFEWFHAAAIVIALACVLELVYDATRSIAIAIAMTLALGLSPLFNTALAPPWEAAAFGACAAVALAAINAQSARHGVAAMMLTLSAILVAALIAPSWAVACAAGAFAIVMQCARRGSVWRPVLAVAAAVTIGGAPLLMLRMTQVAALGRGATWYACTQWMDGAGARALLTVSTLVSTTGSLVLALAALGTLVEMSRPRASRTWAVAALIALAIIPAVLTGDGPKVAMAPLGLAVWMLASRGVQDVVRLMGRGRVATIGTVVLLALVPLLQTSRVHAKVRDNLVRPAGHDRASFGQITRLLNLIPEGGQLVEEDASVDLLIRAAVFGGRRASKPFVVVPLTRDSVTRALSLGAVFAFPHGQAVLSVRGFVVAAIEDPQAGATDRLVHGLATIAGTRRCAELGTSWADLEGVGVSGRVAISADSEDAHGPVVVYFGGSSDYAPGPDAWAPRVRRGFDVSLFRRATEEDSARLDAELRAAGLQAWRVFTAPNVAKLMVRRTPESPLALPIVLGPGRPSGAGRLAADAPNTLPLTICDAPPITVVPF